MGISVKDKPISESERSFLRNKINHRVKTFVKNVYF